MSGLLSLPMRRWPLARGTTTRRRSDAGGSPGRSELVGIGRAPNLGPRLRVEDVLVYLGRPGEVFARPFKGVEGSDWRPWDDEASYVPNTPGPSIPEFPESPNSDWECEWTPTADPCEFTMRCYDKSTGMLIVTSLEDLCNGDEYPYPPEDPPENPPPNGGPPPGETGPGQDPIDPEDIDPPWPDGGPFGTPIFVPETIFKYKFKPHAPCEFTIHGCGDREPPIPTPEDGPEDEPDDSDNGETDDIA